MEMFPEFNCTSATFHVGSAWVRQWKTGKECSLLPLKWLGILTLIDAEVHSELENLEH